jgi:hypothetical protein
MATTAQVDGRVAASVGAILVAVATFVGWYDFTVVANAGGTSQRFLVPTDLWRPYPVAAMLVLAGAIFGLAVLNVPLEVPRPVLVLAAIFGLAVCAYAVVRIVDVPEMGVGRGTTAPTSVDGGPFLAFAGGLLLAIGAAAVAVASAPAPARARRPPRAPYGAAPY